MPIKTSNDVKCTCDLAILYKMVSKKIQSCVKNIKDDPDDMMKDA